jgi:hypothetical protein
MHAIEFSVGNKHMLPSLFSPFSLNFSLLRSTTFINERRGRGEEQQEQHKKLVFIFVFHLFCPSKSMGTKK